MIEREDPTPDREQRFHEIVGLYLEAIDRGAAPSREDLLAQHPEFSAELDEFFASERQLAGLAGPPRTSHHLEATCAFPCSRPVTERCGADRRRSESDRLPRRFGNYELLEVLGQGGMGVVYKAHDQKLGRLVALKMIHPGLLTSATDLQRFRNEALTVARLDHPHILPVYEIGEQDGEPYFTIKLIKGGSLADRLATFREKPREAATLVMIVADALHHAHHHAVLHRDVKPSNILLDHDGRPYVTDFGLARSLNFDQDLTGSGELVGTPSYMAPEMLLGERGGLTAATDVYGLGGVLYSLLTGRPPFREATLLATLGRVANDEPTPPGFYNRRVDRDLQTICLKCLEKDPRRRYLCAGELMDDLHRWLARLPIRARSVGAAEKAWRWCRRSPAVTGLGLAIVVLLVALITFLATSNVRIRQAWESSNQQRALFEERELLARRQAYAARIRQAASLWENGRTRMVREVLPVSMTPPDDDLRGFEWHFLWADSPVRELTRIDIPGGAVDDAAGSPDGHLLALAHEDRSIDVWDVAGSSRMCTLKGHQYPPGALAFAPQSDWLVSAAHGPRRAELNSWRFRSPAEVDAVEWPEPRVFAWTLAFSPDGRSLAVGGFNAEGHGEVRVWEFPSRRLRFTSRHECPCACLGLAFSPDGKVLAAAYGAGERGKMGTAQIDLLDAATGQHQRYLDGHAHLVHRLAFSPDARMLVSGGVDPKIRVWEPSTGRLLGLLPHDGEIAALAFTPDGRRVVSAQLNGLTSILRVWDPANTKLERSLEDVPGEVRHVAFVSGTQRLRILSDDGSLRTWDLEPSEAVRTLPGHRPAEAWSVAFARDGRTLISAGDDHKIRLWDPASCALKGVLTGHHSLVSCLAVSPTGAHLASGSYDHSVRLWDLTTGAPLATLTGHDAAVRAVAFSPDGRTLASAAKDRTIRLSDVASRRVRLVLKGHDKQVRALAFSPDGKTLASGSEDGTLRLWHAGSGTVRLVVLQKSQVWSMAFARDGTSIAVGTQDGRLTVCDVATGRQLAELVGHLGGVRAVAVSPDGKTLASAGEDSTVRLWQAATGIEMLALRGPAAPANAIAFSSDSRSLAAAYHDGAVVLWQAMDEPTASSIRK